jgi:hypothetical protein
MNCQKHNELAFGICAYCGRAVCSQCVSPNESLPLSCSRKCLEQIELKNLALRVFIDQSKTALKVTAYMLYGFAVILFFSGIALYIVQPSSSVLSLGFLIPLGIVSLITGWLLQRTIKQWKTSA